MVYRTIVGPGAPRRVFNAYVSIMGTRSGWDCCVELIDTTTKKNVCQLKTRGYGIDKSPKSDLVMRDGSRKNAVGNTSFSQGNKAIVGDLPG